MADPTNQEDFSMFDEQLACDISYTLSPNMEDLRCDAFINRPHPDMTRPPDAELRELQLDGFENRRISVPANQPAGPALNRPKQPCNLDLYPICAPQKSHGSFNASPIRRVYHDQEERLIKMMGNDRFIEETAPVMGFTTRVVQAILCASTGAKAFHCPDKEGWDVRITSMQHWKQAQYSFPHHKPLFLPYSLSVEAGIALASLMLPGGAAAYGWRFDDKANKDLKDYMPSYARILHPGGSLKVLAVREHFNAVVSFGGSALTVEALSEIENHYRGKWGNEPWDMAYKTIAAMGAVYRDPTPCERNLGEGFVVVQQSTIHNGRDIGRHNTKWIMPERRSVKAVDPDCQSHPWRRSETFLRPLERLINTKTRMILGGGDIPDHVEPQWFWEKREVRATWRTGGSLADLHEIIEDISTTLKEILRSSKNLTSKDRKKLHDAALRYRSEALYMIHSEESRSNCKKPMPSGFRNIFGFADDMSTLTLPHFRLESTFGLIAECHMPMDSNEDKFIEREKLRIQLGNYCLRFHIAHVICLADNHFWPDDLCEGPAEHSVLLDRKMPKKLGNMLGVARLTRANVPASNWLVLEPVGFLRGLSDRTAYWGHQVQGKLASPSQGHGQVVVEMAVKQTSYPTLDAEIRSIWANNGTVRLGCQPNVPFTVVVDADGVVAPFAISPYVNSGGEVKSFQVFLNYH